MNNFLYFNKIDYEKPNHGIQIHHAIFDGYIRGNIGSLPENVILFFEEIFKIYAKDTNIISMLKTNAKLFEKIRQDIKKNFDEYRYQLKQSYFYNVLLTDNDIFSYTHIVLNLFDLKELTRPDDTKEEIVMYPFIKSTQNIDLYLKQTNQRDKISIERPIKEILKEAMNKLHSYYDKQLFRWLDDNNSGILLCGWYGNPGHATTLYFTKITNENKYNVFLFNSGAGLQNHYYDKESKLYSVTYVKYGMESTSLQNLVTSLILFKEFIYCGKNGKEYFYDIIKSIMGPYDMLDKNDAFYKYNMILGQIVGSCTYHSMYYVIKYLLCQQLNEEDYKLYDYYISKYVYNALTDNILAKTKYKYDYYNSYSVIAYNFMIEQMNQYKKKINIDSNIFSDITKKMLMYNEKHKLSVSTCTEAKYKLDTKNDLYEPKLMLIKKQLVNNPIDNNYINSSDDIIIKLTKLTLEIHKVNFIVFNGNKNLLYLYVFERHVIDVLLDVIDSDEINRVMSIESLKLIPEILFKLLFVHRTMVTLDRKKVTHKEIIPLLLMLILLIINDNNKQYYLNKLKVNNTDNIDAILDEYNMSYGRNINKHINKLYDYSYFIESDEMKSKLTQFIEMFPHDMTNYFHDNICEDFLSDCYYQREIKDILLEFDNEYDFDELDHNGRKIYCNHHATEISNFLKEKHPKKYFLYFFAQAKKDNYLLSIYAIINPYDNDVNYWTNNLDDYKKEFGEEPKCNYQKIISKYKKGKNIKCNDNEIINIFTGYRYINMFRMGYGGDNINNYMCLFKTSYTSVQNVVTYKGSSGFNGFDDTKNKLIFFIDSLLSKKYLEMNTIGLAFFEELYYPKLFNTNNIGISSDILISVDQKRNNFKYNTQYDHAYKEQMIFKLFTYINNNNTEIDYSVLSEITILYIVYLLCNNWLIIKMKNKKIMELIEQYSVTSKYSISFKIIQTICDITKRNIFDNEIIYYVSNQLLKNNYHIDSNLNDFNVNVLFYKIYLDKLTSDKINYRDYLNRIINNSHAGTIEIDKIEKIINIQIKTLSFNENNIVVSNDDKSVKILLNESMEITEQTTQMQEYFKKEYLFVHQQNSTYFGYNQKTLRNDVKLVINDDIISIKKILNGKKYYPIVNKKSIFSDLDKDLGVIIMYYTDGTDILLEFPHIFDHKLEKCFSLLLKGEELYYTDNNGNENKIINHGTNFMFNRWINNIPFAFTYIDNKNGKYKILLLDVISKIFFEYFKKNPWSVASGDVIKKFEDEHDNNIRKFYIGDISYNGLGIQFDNDMGLELYILFCLFIGKDDCFNIVFDKYIYAINNKYYDRTNKYLEENLIIYLITNGIINSPYKYYYMNVCSLLFRDQSYDEYTRRVNRGVFFGKHRSMTIEEYKTLNKYEISRKIFGSVKNMKEYLSDKISLPDFENKWDNNNTIIDSCKKIKILLTEKEGLGKIVPLNDNIRTIKNMDDVSFDICLNEFENSFISCENKTSLSSVEQIRSNVTQDLNKFRKYILSILDIVYDSSVHELEFICKFNELIYYLLEINLLLNVLNRIPNSRECMQLKRLYELVDRESTLYNKKRSLEILFVESYSGFYIRDEQFKIYQQIRDEIDYNLKESKKIPYSIYQLLMGRGKTSVIMPLILFNYYLNSNLTNILLISPEHLVKQSFDDILSKFYKILSGGIFRTLIANRHQKMIGGGDLNNTLPTQSKEESSTEKNTEETSNKKIIASHKRVFIMSDTTLKIIKLNEIESGIKEIFRSFVIDEIKNNSLMIMDEVDNMYNPITSNLNFPFPPKEKFNINEEVLQYFIDFIYYVIGMNKYQVRRYSIDEINELYKLFSKENDLLEISVDDIKSKKISESSKALFKTISTCFSLLYRKDYGFPHPETHTNMYIAVPYKSQDAPIKNSEYSDADITIILTILTFMYSDLREQDVINVINSAKNKIKILANVIEKNYLKKIVSKELQVLDITMDYLLEINPALDLDKIKDITNKIRSNKNIVEIKIKYLNEFIIPKITHEMTFLNCSAMDIMNKKIGSYKCGFSGTAAIKLPYWNKYVLEKGFDGTEKSKENYETEFYKIKPINADNGAIYYAILGLHDGKLDNTKNHIYNETKNLEKYNNAKQHINSGDIIYHVIELINQYGYDVVIDAGAFFIGADAEYVTKVIAEYTEFKYYIFIDEKDTKWVYDRQNKIPYNENIDYKKGEIFIFYDNRHIVGIDIKQPYTLKGLATVNTFNKLTEIAQAIFRLRHLNYGQVVDFILHKNISKYNTRKKLLEYLNQSEYSYVNDNVEILKLQMNIISQNKLLNNKYYKVSKYDIYNEINKINSPNYDTNYYLSYVKNLNFTNDKLINELYKKLALLYNKHKEISFIGTNYEQEKQMEEQLVVEVKTNLYTNTFDVGITNFTFFLTDIKLENYCQPEGMNHIRNGKYYNGINEKEYFDSFRDWIMYKPPNKYYLFDDTGAGYNNRDEIINGCKDLILMENMNIFMSPIFRFIKIKKSDIYLDSNNRYDPQKQSPISIDDLRSMDYYYAKISNDKSHNYILLSSIEFILIRQYLNVNKITITTNCIIKNKDGQIMYGDEKNKLQMEPTELFVQLLLGKKMNLLEYIHMAELIKHDLSDIKKLLNVVSKQYGIVFYNEYFLEVLNNSNWKSAFDKFESFVVFLGKFCNLQINTKMLRDSEYMNIIEQIRLTIQKRVNHRYGGSSCKKKFIKKTRMY